MAFKYMIAFERHKLLLKNLFNECINDKDFEQYKGVLNAFIQILDFEDDFLENIDSFLSKKEVDLCTEKEFEKLQENIKIYKDNKNDDFFDELETSKKYIISNFLLINYECLSWYMFQQYQNVNTYEYISCKNIINALERGIYNFDKYIIDNFIKISIYMPKLSYDNYMKNNYEIRKRIDDLDNFIKEIEKHNLNCNNLNIEMHNIENRLKNQRQEFNFIGLSNAFQKMKDDKNEELKNENSNNKIFMRCIIGILLAKLMWSVHYVNFETYNPATLTVITISSIFVVAILLYFFRISLHNIKAIQSQILQLDLRLSLCQFIHNYATDSKEMRTNMKESLERFESVIFAPIVATDDKIPATLDGMEQLGKLVDMVKKP